MIGNFKKSVLHQKWHNRDNTAGALKAMGKAVLTVSVKFCSKGIPSANTGGYYAPAALVVGRRGPKGGSHVRSWVALPTSVEHSFRSKGHAFVSLYSKMLHT